MRAADAVKLYAHNGRMLSRPEILIDQFHDVRNAEQKKLADERISEKMMLSRISSKLISIPTVRFLRSVYFMRALTFAVLI